MTASILIAGLRGGSGKTLVSLGLAAAWRERALRVAPFKKGPDYIDAAWLSTAAGSDCRNLDSFLMSDRSILGSFVAASRDADVALIEGNRGLFDGMDADGSHSSAELAKRLKTPVVLVVDCTKSTRTIGALVLGCQRLDPEVPLRGVILNRLAGERHESVVRESIVRITGLPVLGAIPRIRERLFPERHLGLVPPDEHKRQVDEIRRAAEIAERYLDLDALLHVAQTAPTLKLPEDAGAEPKRGTGTSHSRLVNGFDAPQLGASPPVRIGLFRDAAFQFYYPENIEALEREGAELVEVSPLSDATIPQVDAIYMGGGFPETSAAALSENRAFADSLRQAIEGGLPVYAECGGTVYLGEKLLHEEREYPMSGVLPVVFGFGEKPQGHGYTVLETIADNSFYPVGETVRGHEFHYTFMESTTSSELTFAFRVCRGHGFDGERDGLCYRNVLACYTHIHALGTPRWAGALVDAAVRFRGRTKSVEGGS